MTSALNALSATLQNFSGVAFWSQNNVTQLQLNNFGSVMQLFNTSVVSYPNSTMYISISSISAFLIIFEVAVCPEQRSRWEIYSSSITTLSLNTLDPHHGRMFSEMASLLQLKSKSLFPRLKSLDVDAVALSSPGCQLFVMNALPPSPKKLTLGFEHIGPRWCTFLAATFVFRG